jgi:signal recognition particle receptor subunit beta
VEAPRAKAKVVVVGDTGVGKRSLVRRSSIDPVADRYVDSLGAKVSKKEILLPVRLRDGTVLDLILWTVGAGTLRGRGRTFVSRAVGIFAVCDATRRDSLVHLADFVRIIFAVSGEIPVVVAVNKWDMGAEREIEVADAAAFAGTYGSDFFLTSATTGEKVEAAFQSLGERIVEFRRARAEREGRQGPP